MNDERVPNPRPLVWTTAFLALLAYVPAFIAAPGRMPADSKLYLYLNPGRFLGDAASTFDPRQFAGWVPHQHIAYLWPAGPWFWVFDTLGVPDWVAHRLWIGTLMVAAGVGVRWCARLLGFGQVAALVAAVVYQVSPYVLPYVSRTSVMLLPWAGLGWIVAFTVRATRQRGWRDAAWIALVVFTVGAVNATALAMIVPAPVIWLVHAVWQRTVSWRDAVVVGVRVVLLTVPVCLWWVAMLLIQGKYGAEVLPYSESLSDVSFTATGPEVWRGLGYWLFYVRDSYAATTTESLRYLSSTAAIGVSFLVPIVGLSGLTFVRWAHRRFAMLLVAAGAVLAVGVHPITDRSPLMRVLAGDDEGGLALALRSSTRALPVMNLGLALGAGALAAACGALRLPRLRLPAHRVAGGLVIMLAIVNLPALWNGAFVDPALERDQDPPRAWLDAAAALDRAGGRGRVLQVPGTEFGAYAWGYTVDQPLPALTNEPLVTRDLLPLGSAPAMDLVYALDDRIQDGVLEPGSVAPVSRWLGVDTVWVTNDLDTERFRTAHPQLVERTLDAADGVGQGRDFGPVTLPAGETDEHLLAESDPASWASAPVTLHRIDDPGAVVRAGDRTVVVSGSGEGLVDLAAAGVVDGGEVVRYSASVTGDALADELDGAAAVLVTDSNRDQARHWRSSQDTRGYTESDQPGLDLLRTVAADQRLPVFAERDAVVDPATQTVARQEGAVTATATSYGEPFAYLPERRPFMAIDGDVATAWTVGEHADPVGEVLRLHLAQPVASIALVQPDPRGGRRITEVVVRAGDAPAQRITLDDRSLAPTGQPVDIGGADTVDIEIAAVGGGTPFTASAVQGVGIAEVVTGLAPTVEVVRPPHDALGAVGSSTPLALTFTRWRVDAMDRWRSDPEPLLVREFELPSARSFDGSVTVRLDRRATDAALAELFGWDTTASSRLTGSVTNVGAAAFDGDIETAWRTPFDGAVGAVLHLPAAPRPVDRLDLVLPARGSTITELLVSSGGASRQVAVVTGTDRRATVTLDPPLPAGPIDVEIAAIDPVTVTDRRFGDALTLPAGIAEIVVPGVDPTPVVSAASVDLECVPLLAVDGVERRYSFSISADDGATGTAVTAEPCDGPIELAAGAHVVTSAPVAASGLPVTVDRVVLDAGATTALAAASAADGAGPTVTLARDGRFDRSIVVSDCPDGCWLVVGEGYNTAWEAEVAGVSLGAPTLVDGGFNGWWLPGFEGSVTVDVAWSQQRTLELAMAASALGVLIALVLLIVSRRERLAPFAVVPPAWAWTPDPLPVVPVGRRRMLGVTLPSGGEHSFGWRATVLVVSWSALAALLIQPEWVVWGAIAGFGAALWQRPRLPELTALASLVAVAALVILRERRNAPTPGGGWPFVFESWHGLAMFAVVSLLVGALTADDAAYRRTRTVTADHDPGGRPTPSS